MKNHIKIIQKKPFFWRILKWYFPEYNPAGDTAVSFGTFAYANAPTFEESYQIHESVHFKQQHHSKLFAVWWWIRYLNSKSFRYQMELEAFGEQYLWIRYNYKPHTHWQWHERLSEQLASPLYGSMVTKFQAKNILKNYGKK